MRKLFVTFSVLMVAVLLVGAVSADQPKPFLTGDANASRVPGTAGTGTLWENGEFDSLNGLASELNTAVTDARTADDFALDPACPLYNIDVIRGQMIQFSNPLNAQVEIYADSGGNGPVNAPPIATFPLTSYTIVGTAFGYNVYEYTYNTAGLQLPPGHYWVSSIGLGDGSFADRAFFMTAGNGILQLQEGYFLSNYFGVPLWAPASGQLGVPTDFAFDIDGACVQQNIAVHINKMKMNKAPAARPGYYKVVTALRVKDAGGNVVGGITVTGDYTYPDSSVHTMTFVTTPLGQAKFPIKQNLLGTYTFTVTNMTGTGYYYDPAANEMGPSMSVVVP